MRVLVVGSGGREHAITWALTRSSQVREIAVAPGNAGTEDIARNLDVTDIPGLVYFATRQQLDLVVVGPEEPLANGLVDALQAEGIPAFGPTQAAAQIEASKAFAKAFMQQHGIPTAEYETFDDYDAASNYVNKLNRPVVVKADGLAAGKGVFVCDDVPQALEALKTILLDSAFGAAGGRVIVEERLTGPELSVLAFCDGKSLKAMPSARDHKRAYDGDAGPNTGGMGAFAPVPDISLEYLGEIAQSCLQPVIDGLAAQGTPYVGVLYAGLMLTPDGPKVLEYNCRFGDPETQVILPLLESDLFEVMQHCVNGTLDQMDIQWKSGACATVVAASPGYPGSYPKGLPITGTDDVQDALVFHAGTDYDTAGRLMTVGGRVLAVSGVGDDLDDALMRAYREISHIHFEGMYYRRDIGRT